MNHSHSPSRKYFRIFIFLFFLISFSVYAATQLPWGGDEKVENGFLVTVGSSKEITVWSECKKVTATTKNVYVPTRTKNEWDQFKLKAGNVGASISACGCIIPIVNSCSAPVPACETTTNGTDSCGIPCTRTGGACACAVTSCSADPNPICGTTSYGTDNCGGSCSISGGPCICGGDSATISSPDTKNSCSFTWYDTPLNGSVDIVGTGDPAGKIHGLCVWDVVSKKPVWNYTYDCPNPSNNPIPTTCNGIYWTVNSLDGSNSCTFSVGLVNVGYSNNNISGTGIPPGNAQATCTTHGWDYLGSCPNAVTKTCGFGESSFGTACYFIWPTVTPGYYSLQGNLPNSYVSGTCGADGNWGGVTYYCPY